MKPNIFLHPSHCPEDFFSHGLAYVLMRIPGLGDRFASRIAVLAGKDAEYFGRFRECEFVAHEFPQDHTTSRPDLKLVCDTRAIHFENKLDSPLSVDQLLRHSALIGKSSSDHLLFVSNILHRSPALRKIPGYLHPKNADHYLWVDLLSVLDSHDRKGSLASRVLTDFREALKAYGMVGRRISGAAGSLYTRGSEASHSALIQLSQTLSEVGFKVAGKPARESTLRVYPRQPREHPLLNPRFYATASWLKPQLDFESLILTVLSRPEAPNLDGQLAEFASRRDCTFVPADSSLDSDGYRHHGHFVLPVRFSGTGETTRIDFATLKNALSKIHGFLNHPSP